MNQELHHKVFVIHLLNNKAMRVHIFQKIFHNHYEELVDHQKQHRKQMHMVQEEKEIPLENVLYHQTSYEPKTIRTCQNCYFFLFLFLSCHEKCPLVIAQLQFFFKITSALERINFRCTARRLGSVARLSVGAWL